MDTLPWIEKYRPSTLDGIISHSHIINTLKIFAKNKCLPHLLFYGPPGCGKTSTIMALSSELYGTQHNFMVMELNASDDRGIEVVRDKIKKFVVSKNMSFSGNVSMFKLVILDEIDAMTPDAQAILRKIIEQYTVGTRFCLICNCIQKIIPALQSRCTKFRFSPINNIYIKNYIMNIVDKENLNMGSNVDDCIQTIIDRSCGDVRKILNMLQSTSMICNEINETNINKCLGYPQRIETHLILNHLLNDDFETCYVNIIKIKTNEGLALSDIVTEIHGTLMNHVLGIVDIFSKLSDKQIIHIMSNLRDIEVNLSMNANDTIQVCGLISLFIQARHLI